MKMIGSQVIAHSSRSKARGRLVTIEVIALYVGRR
jgi:hypothetical protein